MLMEWQLFKRSLLQMTLKKKYKTAEKPRRGDEAEIEQNTRSL